MTRGTGAASWTPADESLLVNLLCENASAAGEGGNFKSTTFQAVATELEKKRTQGGPKTTKACQNKYASFRRIYRAIQAIQAKSGWTWSDSHGANITGDMEDAWRQFLSVHKDAKPFKNAGWVHREKMAKLMPSSVK
ncbi:hypothetical protein H0H93_001667, partial [Arthromyces matolae]